MTLVRLVYVSRMTEACDTQALKAILDTSRANNREKEITGVLCYDPAFFMQCLEGPRELVNALYASILRDARHKDVTLLEYSDITERSFGKWSMAFLPATHVEASVITKYAPNGKLNPYALNGHQARGFLLDMVEGRKDLE